jgi:uncharacterized protein (TIGR03086 family)
MDAAVRGLSEGELDQPSKCANWTKGDLIRHMTGQNHGFALAIAHGDAPGPAFRPLPKDHWSSSVAELRSALSEPAQQVRLAEVLGGSTWPLQVAVAMHTLDCAVHTWDLLGDAYRPRAEVVDTVLELSLQIPAERAGDDPFAPIVPGSSEDPWVRALNLLGRVKS